MIGRYECHEYTVPVAGMSLRLLGPRQPHAWQDDPSIETRFQKDGYLPFWRAPSPAAVMLAEHVIRVVAPTPEPILELGTGLGLVALALARAGHRVIATDFDETALAFVRASADINGVNLYAVRRLDWREPPHEQFRTIVASDVVYEKQSRDPIAKLLTRCLSSNGAAFLSDPYRSASDDLAVAFAAHGLSCESASATARAIPGPESIDGRILRGRVHTLTHHSNQPVQA